MCRENKAVGHFLDVIFQLYTVFGKAPAYYGTMPSSKCDRDNHVMSIFIFAFKAIKVYSLSYLKINHNINEYFLKILCLG